MNTSQPTIGLFATCLVDLMRPAVGFAAAKLLQDAGCRVEVPTAQTCCGQPAYNSGDSGTARDIAKQVIAAFEGFDYVVAPSGSCAGQIKKHYPELLADDPAWSARAAAVGEKTYELLSFLTDVMGVAAVDARLDGVVTYHDSCSGLRELGVKEQPRTLLASVQGLTLKEGEKTERCCGFGGLFSVKYPDISGAMVDEKVADIEATGASMVLGGDLGCLMNIAGRLQRKGSTVTARHTAEVLAGMTGDVAPIGEGPDGKTGGDGQ